MSPLPCPVLVPPSLSSGLLDDWFLGAQPPPVPFFPEVHEEVTRSWKAPFSARNRASASSVLTTLDGGAAQGYVEIPPVERAIAMQLWPQSAAAWRGNPSLPSRACKLRAVKPRLHLGWRDRLEGALVRSNGQGLQSCWTGCFRPARHGPPAGPPGQGVEAAARGWC